MQQNKLKTCSNYRKFAIITFVIFFAAMGTGFISKSFSLQTSAGATRLDMLAEIARLLKILSPLLNSTENQQQASVANVGLPQELEEAAGLGIIKIFPDGSWKLNSQITRGECVFYFDQLLTILSSRMKYPPVFIEANVPFTDIAADHWLNKSAKKLGGLGALSFAPAGAFNCDSPISNQELRFISAAFLDYLSSNLLLINFDGKIATISSKGALQEISMLNWSYSFDAIKWQKLPENGQLKPGFLQNRICRIFFRHPAYQDAGPIQLFNKTPAVGYIKLQRNFLAVVSELAEKPEKAQDKSNERERIRRRLEELKSKKFRAAAPEIVESKPVETPQTETFIPAPPETVQELNSPEPELPRTIAAEVILKNSPQIIHPDEGESEDADLSEIENEIAVENDSEPLTETTPATPPGFGARIVDALTGQSIHGAMVIIDAKQYSTDAEGWVSFNARPGSSLELTAYCEGYEALQMKHRPGYRNGPLIISLKPVLINFSGKITCQVSGNPVSGAVIRIGEKATRTGEDGAFTISGLQSGYQQLSCIADKYMEAHEIVYVQKDAARFELSISPTFTARSYLHKTMEEAEN